MNNAQIIANIVVKFDRNYFEHFKLYAVIRNEIKAEMALFEFTIKI